MSCNTWFDAGEGPTPTELIGRYRLVGLADTGRNGALFRAHDTVRGEAIAVRAVPRELTADARTRILLIRELQRARRLCHPNVLRPHELVVVPTDMGADVLVTTEYVPGQSLARRIRAQGPLPLPEVLQIGRRVAEALIAAHGEGVLHCDVSPEHVLLGDDGRILLTDFGLGPALGGARGGRLDERIDVYGLGAVLHASLTGRTDPAPACLELGRDVPVDLAEIVLRCLAGGLREQWASVDRVRAALDRVVVPAGLRSVGAAPRSLGGPRVAVHPLTAEPRLQHLAGAVADEIAQTLAMTDGLRIRLLRGAGAEEPGAFDAAIHGELSSDGPDLVLSLRLVAAPSGWRLWLGRLDIARSSLLSSANRAAQAIARALAASEAPARPSGPSDPEALDLLLRGQHEARGGAPRGTFDRSAALLELSRARAPRDPRVLAAVAATRLRRVGSAELLASAERLAREAVVRGPSLPETHLALAEILRSTGDDVGAARSVRRALALSPGSAAALAAAGALWREAGEIEASVAHLEQACALDPESSETRVELARGWALLGRSETLVVPPIDQHRFALWFPDRPTVLGKDPGDDPRVELLDAIHRGRRVPESAYGVFESTDADRRARAEAAQLGIEGRVYAGAEEGIFDRLDRAAREGLVDLVWLDRCPVLARLRRDPRFAAARQAATGRAGAIRRALGG